MMWKTIVGVVVLTLSASMAAGTIIVCRRRLRRQQQEISDLEELLVVSTQRDRSRRQEIRRLRHAANVLAARLRELAQDNPIVDIVGPAPMPIMLLGDAEQQI